MGRKRHIPAASPPEKRPSTHCTGDQVSPHGRSEEVQKISPPPEFDLWTIQAITCCCINLAIPAHTFTIYWSIIWPIHLLPIGPLSGPYIDYLLVHYLAHTFTVYWSIIWPIYLLSIGPLSGPYIYYLLVHYLAHTFTIYWSIILTRLVTDCLMWLSHHTFNAFVPYTCIWAKTKF